MDLQLPETLEARGLQGEELLCSQYLTDIKLKLQHPVDSLVIDDQPPPPTQPRSSSKGQNSSGLGVPGPSSGGAPARSPGGGPRSGGSGSKGGAYNADVDSTIQRSLDRISGGGQELGPHSDPNAMTSSSLKNSQLGPGSKPDFRDSEDVFIRNPDERPIKPAKRLPYWISGSHSSYQIALSLLNWCNK